MLLIEAITRLFVRRIRGLFRAYSVGKGVVRGTQHMHGIPYADANFDFFSQNNGFQAEIENVRWIQAQIYSVFKIQGGGRGYSPKIPTLRRLPHYINLVYSFFTI